MDDQTVAGFLECSHQESDTLLKQEWHGNGSGLLLWPTLTTFTWLHTFTRGLGIVLNICWNTKRRDWGMISFWRLLVAPSTMMILSFRMGGFSKGVWEQMKGWNRRSVNHIVGIFCLVSSTCKYISAVFCSVDLVFIALYGAAFSSNSSNSNNQIWNECSWFRFTTIKARQVSLHLPNDISGVHFISVLKWKLFEPPAPIWIPLSITNGRYSFLTKVDFRRGGSLHPQQLTYTDPEPYRERGHRTSNFRSGGKLWTASCAFQSIWAEILRRGEVKTKSIAMIAMDYCIVDQN